MQFDVYLLLMLLSLAVVGYGLFHKEGWYAILGFSFLFYMGIILMSGGLTVESGVNVTSVNASFTTISYNHDMVDDSYTRWFGRFIAMGSALGLATVFFMLKSFYGKGANSDE